MDNQIGRVAGLRDASIWVKLIAICLLTYLLAIGLYALMTFATTKSKLATYGVSEATATLAGTVVMVIALGLPAMAIVKLLFWKARAWDYAAILVLPTISWGIAQIPAKFDAMTGASLRYCSLRPDGTKFCLDRPGFDPLTQRPLQQENSQAAEEDFRRDRGLLPRPITAPLSSIVFFDPINGKPRVWFSKDEAGCFNLFDNPGIDPSSGDKLHAVNAAVVRAIKKCYQPTPAAAAKEPKDLGPATTTADSSKLPVSQQSIKLKKEWQGIYTPSEANDRVPIGNFEGGRYRLVGERYHEYRLQWILGDQKFYRMTYQGKYVDHGYSKTPYTPSGPNEAKIPFAGEPFGYGAVFVWVNQEKFYAAEGSCFSVPEGAELWLDVNLSTHAENRRGSGGHKLQVEKC
jgi:hypothetical protein